MALQTFDVRGGVTVNYPTPESFAYALRRRGAIAFSEVYGPTATTNVRARYGDAWSGFATAIELKGTFDCDMA